MSAPVSESTHRKRVARGLLLMIFLGLRVADCLLFWYLSRPGNASALMSGAVVGSILWTTTLLGAIWRRQSWARYVLITFNCGFIALFSYPVLVAWGTRELAPTFEYQLIITAVVLYSTATALLVCSRRIRHLAAMSMIGR